MMFKKYGVLIAMILFSTILQAQDSRTSHQKIQEAIVRMFDALSKRDSIRLKANCTPNVSFYEYGQVWNIDTLIYKAITLNSAIDFNRTNKFEFLTTETAKNTAWVTYRLYSEILKDGKKTLLEWLETVALTKQNKQWKVAHLHSTLVKRN
jgi:SnoaL-like domain